MPNLFCNTPEPYLFKGGDPSNYEVFVGKAGTWCTRHIESNQSVQSVQPSINLGGNVPQPGSFTLGVLNLGVGIYNAFKLHQIHDELTEQHQEVQVGLANIHNTLNAQYRILELLVSNQNSFSHRLDILRQEIHFGFQKVLEGIQDIEAHRRREDFEIRTFKVLRAYEWLGDLPSSPTGAERLIDRAEELEAWLRSQLNRIQEGRAERLPLLAILCFSVRAKVDAFEAKGDGYSNFSIRELNALKAQISKEAYDFCKGRSLYMLGVEMPEILGQYVLLNRGIQKSISLQTNTITKDPTDELFSQEEVTWDDGLDSLREVFQASTENTETLTGKTTIDLKTLADYDWYVRFANENRSSFNVHSRQSIVLTEILQKIGHPRPNNAVIRKQDLDTLKLFALPDARSKSANLIQSEFQWEQSPQLLYTAT